MSDTVRGTYVTHSPERGFLYEYHCSRCKRRYLSTAPEENAPVLCHGCYTGRRYGAGQRRRDNRPHQE